jgi:hypothetical protein
MDDRYEPTTGSAPGMATADIWTYHTQPGIVGSDLVGFHVEATDGGIGKIDEASEEAGRNLLVVDTGPWIFGKKVLVPAGIIDRVDLDGETVYVNRTKDEIKNAPEFDRDTHIRDEEYHNRLGSYYAGSDTSRSDF